MISIEAHCCFVYSVGCFAAILWGKLNIQWWLVRPCYSLSRYGTFTETAGGQRERRGLHHVSSRSSSPSALWPTVDTFSCPAAWRRLGAVSDWRTYCRCTHTHTVLFICLCHISPQVESGVSRLTASVQGAIEVWLYRRPKAVSRIAWLPWQRRDHLFAAVMEWYNGPEEGRGGGRTLWGVHQSTARRSTDSVWSIID